MSTPSSKTIVMTDRPYFETERSWSSRGRPRIETSRGYVTNFSTSRGDMPGAADRSSTWMFVTSGKASSGIFRNEVMPNPMRIRTQMATSRRCLRVKETIRSIMANPGPASSSGART